MNRDHLYAFYGSLRQGMSNYRKYRYGMEYLFTATLPGYRLYALRWYPYAVRTADPGSSIVVEVFRVLDEEVENGIHELELNEGFTYDEVEVGSLTVGIYVFEAGGTEPSVEGGDWVKFFGSR